MRPVFPEQQKGVRLDAQKVSYADCRVFAICYRKTRTIYYNLLFNHNLTKLYYIR